MSKKEQISNLLKTELFDIGDIDYINEKMEANLSILLTSKEYVDLNKKFKSINLKLASTLDSNQRKNFKEYTELELEISSYENCLAYYLGCKAMLDTDKLK